MDFKETMEWIGQANMRGISLGLERMRTLSEKLGDPQDDLKIIHVAGTNGKGSVCTMIAGALASAGCRVGRYISPTLFDYRERIQINGEMIGEADLATVMTKVKAAVEAMADEGLEVPTAFEIETAAAFLYFKEKKCDYVVLEVGMGGRLDSTNIIRYPVLTVITKIAMDHMGMLGDTLADIAFEKAGIIKAEVPVVSMLQEDDAMTVIQKQADNNGSKLIIADPADIQIKARRIEEIDGRPATVQRIAYKDIEDIVLCLGGTYQTANAAVAIEALRCLPNSVFGLKGRNTCIVEGFGAARWPGRFECIHTKPMIWIDGAHNPDGARALVDSVKNYFALKKCVIVMGVFADKDYKEILHIVSALSDTIVTFTPENARGLSSQALAQSALPFFDEIVDAQNAEHAVKCAMHLVDEDDVVIVLGSLSTVMTMHAICDIL